MQASSLKQNVREELFKAVIISQSYLHGYNRPVYTVRYFARKLWDKYIKCLKNNLDKLNNLFVPKYTSKPQFSYIDSILTNYPDHLHKMYMYATSHL